MIRKTLVAVALGAASVSAIAPAHAVTYTYTGSQVLAPTITGSGFQVSITNANPAEYTVVMTAGADFPAQIVPSGGQGDFKSVAPFTITVTPVITGTTVIQPTTYVVVS